jgi:sugar O-acyltransferase (sialic acid O-acetyltransferase NeuD family)
MQTAEKPAVVKQSPAKLSRLWIIGAGGYGRELFSMTFSAFGRDETWQVAGFLNDIPDALDGYPGLPPIVDDTDYQPRDGDLFICAIGDAAGRRSVCEKFEKRGANFINLLQHTSMRSPFAVLGHRIIMEAYTGVGAHARIGDFTSVLWHATIAHDVNIGRFVQISPYAAILGGAQLGDEIMVGRHAVILPHVKVGSGATIGAGSIVIKDVPEGATVFGAPAMRIK